MLHRVEYEYAEYLFFKTDNRHPNDWSDSEDADSDSDVDASVVDSDEDWESANLSNGIDDESDAAFGRSAPWAA